MTAFLEIIETAVERTPGAIGGAFAAADGEIVDTITQSDPFEWAVLIAHYGVLLGHMQSALATVHYGQAEFVTICHNHTDILLCSVTDGYYALLAANHPVPLGRAIEELTLAASRLREEMR